MKEENFIRVKTANPAGDLLAAMAGIKELHKNTGIKSIIYQHINSKGQGYEGAKHPFKDEQDDPIKMNEYMFNMLRPLLISQEYIEDYIIFEGQEYEYDLDKARMETFTNQPRGSLNRWLFYVYPQMSCDLSKEWLHVSREKIEKVSGKIIVNFTDRYRNYLLNYFFLKKYEQHIIFAGLYDEYEQFCDQWKIEVPYLIVDNFLELAQAIKSCKFFLGNQSSCFQLAEAMKVPRLLEISPNLPNVIPIGENAYDGYHQNAIEYLFGKLFNNC